MGWVRASAMKQILENLESSESADHARVLSRLRPELVQEIRVAPRLEWMAFDLNMEVVRAITAELGLEAGEDFFHRIYADVMRGPVLGALFRGIRTLGADSPASYLKHAGRAYPLVFRDVGRVSISERSPTSLTLQYEELPSEVFEDGASWIRYAAASYRCVFDFSRKGGKFSVVAMDEARGRCTLVCEWDG